MKVLVCGGRNYSDRTAAFANLDYHATGATLIISGMARGADRLAQEWAISRGVPYQGFPADWENDGLRAGPIRNQRMLDEGKPDLVIAFPGGNGTFDMVKRAMNAGIPVRIIRG